MSNKLRKMLVDPKTNKKARRVYVEDKGWYTWNSVYRVYNSDVNYYQLTAQDIPNIIRYWYTK